MGISQYIVAACGVATTLNNQASAAAQFAFICIYISFFASTFGPGAWVVTGEVNHVYFWSNFVTSPNLFQMFPLKMRAKCLSLTTASNWLFNWLISFIIPYLLGTNYANLGSNVFWIWGGFCWLSVIFVYFLVYETKGLSLEQVNELYEICPKAWKSNEAREGLGKPAGEFIGKEMRLKQQDAEMLEEADKPEERKLETIED